MIRVSTDTYRSNHSYSARKPYIALQMLNTLVDRTIIRYYERSDKDFETTWKGMHCRTYWNIDFVWVQKCIDRCFHFGTSEFVKFIISSLQLGIRQATVQIICQITWIFGQSLSSKRASGMYFRSMLWLLRFKVNIRRTY